MDDLYSYQLIIRAAITAILVMLAVFFVCRYLFKREKERNLILCDVIKLNYDYLGVIDGINRREYKNIYKNLTEISLMLDIITYDAKINSVKLVKINENKNIAKEFEYLKRELKRLNDDQINDLFNRKNRIINRIAKYQSPFKYLLTCISDLFGNKLDKGYECETINRNTPLDYGLIA